MVDIKLPCEIGMRVKNKNDGSEWRIIGYEIRGNGIPHETPYRAMAQAVDVDNNDNQVLISSRNGVFPYDIEVIGW